MDLIRSAISTATNYEVAVKEVSQLLHKEPSLVLFFSSTIHDFTQLSQRFHQQFPNSDVVGVTTAGEIGPMGFSENSLVVQSYAKTFGKITPCLMNDIIKYPIFDRQNVIQAAQQTAINLTTSRIAHEGLALIFPTGLGAGEEKMLSIVNSIFQHEGFPIFGGTAGDDTKFEKTYVSLNGKVSSEGGIVLFMKPSVKFKVVKENIFIGTGKTAKITKADTEKRTVYEIDGKRAASTYAQLLNVPEAQLSQYFMSNPIGRRFNDELFIASPFRVIENGAIEFYCQVFNDSIIEILQPKNPVDTLKETLQYFTSEFKELEGVLACNCILRKLQFQHQNLIPTLNNQLKVLPNLGGFSSYGEQLNKSLINQTLVMIGFGH